MTRNEESAETDSANRRRGEPGDWVVEGYAEGEATYLADVSRSEAREARGAFFYDEREERVFEADADEEGQRYVPREGTEHEHEPGPDETLGDVLEDLGERLDRDSLSAFARDHLADDRDGGEAPRPETVTFTQGNVLPDADHDAEFTGVYRYGAADGRVVDVERTFEVTFDDPDGPDAATVDVRERVLRAEEADQAPGRGDADVIDERATAFEVDLAGVDADRRAEAVVEERCEQWHEQTEPEPPV